FFLIFESSNAQLVPESSFGSTGNGQGQFTSALDIAIAPNGNIYVSDYSNKIVVFDPSGNFLFQFGSAGSLSGQFNYPASVVIDSNGNVFVLDKSNHRIQKFDMNGNLLTIINLGSNAGLDIAVDPIGGNLYVNYNYAINQYSNSGTYIGN